MSNATNKTAPKSAPAAAKAAPKAAPAPAAAPAAAVPLFVMGGWPAKAQGGNSIRAYCYSTALALLATSPNGVSAKTLASAFAAGLPAWVAQGGKAPGTGFGTAAKPNGAAMAHANWFAAPAQGWLAPAPTAKA